MVTRTIARTALSCLIVWHSCQCQAFVASKGIQNRWGLQASDKSNNCVTTADVLSLDSIRSTLIRQEETIIFAMIERSQFRLNPSIYVKGGFGDLGVPLGSTPPGTHEEPLSFLEYMLVGTVRTPLQYMHAHRSSLLLSQYKVKFQCTNAPQSIAHTPAQFLQEALHSGVRRYTSPEEHAFFPDRLPQGLLLTELNYPSLLMDDAKQINFNPILLQKYINVVVPSITNPGDDEQHGSTVISDILVLQALSRRVHYGKFVAESKYRADPDEYQRLVDNNDPEGVMVLLTNAAVEAQVVRRARVKAATYGRDPALAVEDAQGVKVDPAVIETIYRNFIIPLTKDVEVAYLFRRCGKEPPTEYAPDRMSVDFQLAHQQKHQQQQQS